MEEIIQKCRSTGVSKVLWDSENVIRNSSITDSYGYAELAGQKVNFPLKIAVYTQKEVDESRFIENIYHNRGITVQFFNSKEDSIEWLSKKSEV
jgi:hypothetical protein